MTEKHKTLENIDINTLEDALLQIERLRAENAALRASAERYQWLRGRNVDAGMIPAPEIKCRTYMPGYKATAWKRVFGSGSILDSAIDAAMKINP